jgi:hypothetical protein
VIPGSPGSTDWQNRYGPRFARTSVHAIVLPGREPMTSELAQLLELVRGQRR